LVQKYMEMLAWNLVVLDNWKIGLTMWLKRIKRRIWKV
jgi:hypothetical protein